MAQKIADTKRGLKLGRSTLGAGVDWNDLKKHPALTGGTIRTQQYVEEQCRQLCEQAEVDARLR